MGYFDVRGEGIGGSVDAVFEARERNGSVVPLAKFAGTGVALGLPERVQHPDQSPALAEVVVEVEDLEAAVAGCAQAGLDLLVL